MRAIFRRLSRSIRKWAGHLPLWVTMLFGVLMIAALAAIDYHTGYEISFSIFYLLPVLYVTWYAGLSSGLILASLSAATWGLVDFASGARYSSHLIPVWNSIVRLAFFSLTTALLNEMRNAHEAIRAIAFTDSLTGVRNSHSFYSDLEREIERHRRYGRFFTLAYIDLDHFKSVNDTLGHATGNELLRVVATVLQTTFRDVDIVGRLGGDEFCVILPETGAEMAMIALVRAHKAISKAMHAAVTSLPDLGATIGAVVFSVPPSSADAAIQLADDLMYHGKRSERGLIRLSVLLEDGLTEPVSPVQPRLTT